MPREPRRPNDVPRFLFNTVHLLPKDFWFEHGVAKLAFCPEQHQTSARPCVTLGLFAKILFCRLKQRKYSFGHWPKFMTMRKDRNTDRLKNWRLCGVWKLPFRDHRAIKLALPIRVSITPLRLPYSWRKFHPWVAYVDFFTCCNVLPLTRSIHRLGFLERHRTPVF